MRKALIFLLGGYSKDDFHRSTSELRELLGEANERHVRDQETIKKLAELVPRSPYLQNKRKKPDATLSNAIEGFVTPKKMGRSKKVKAAYGNWASK